MVLGGSCVVQWNANDLAVMEEALKQALANEADYQAIYAYQEVLNKLKGGVESGSLTASVGKPANKDGMRFDYDDASDLY